MRSSRPRAHAPEPKRISAARERILVHSRKPRFPRLPSLSSVPTGPIYKNLRSLPPRLPQVPKKKIKKFPMSPLDAYPCHVYVCPHGTGSTSFPGSDGFGAQAHRGHPGPHGLGDRSGGGARVDRCLETKERGGAMNRSDLESRVQIAVSPPDDRGARRMIASFWSPRRTDIF